MKKKTVSVILAAVMGFGLLAGCGGDKKACLLYTSRCV